MNNSKKNSVHKLCIDCRFHKVEHSQHMCYYPDWLSNVDGGGRFCSIMRDNPYNCAIQGKHWTSKEPKVESLKPTKKSWWRSLPSHEEKL